MDYYCDVCDTYIKPKSKYNHIKSNTHKEFDKCNHIKLTNENHYINKINNGYYSYIIEHNRKYDYYLLKAFLN